MEKRDAAIPENSVSYAPGTDADQMTRLKALHKGDAQNCARPSALRPVFNITRGDAPGYGVVAPLGRGEEATVQIHFSMPNTGSGHETGCIRQTCQSLHPVGPVEHAGLR